MTARIGDVVVIAAEAPEECAFCHEVKELRPCGPNEERLCFECGQKDPEALGRYATKLFGKKLAAELGSHKS